MKIQIVIFTDDSWNWKDSKGNIHRTKMYRLVLENGKTIPFKPIFNDDYSKLDVIAEVVKIDTPKKDKK